MPKIGFKQVEKVLKKKKKRIFCYIFNKVKNLASVRILKK